MPVAHLSQGPAHSAKTIILDDWQHRCRILARGWQSETGCAKARATLLNLFKVPVAVVLPVFPSISAIGPRLFGLSWLLGTFRYSPLPAYNSCGDNDQREN